MIRCKDEVPCVVQRIVHLHTTLYMIEFFDGTKAFIRAELSDLMQDNFYEHIEALATEIWFGRIHFSRNLTSGELRNCS